MLQGALCKDTIPPLEDDGFCAGEPMVTTVSKAVWDLWASCITRWLKLHPFLLVRRKSTQPIQTELTHRTISKHVTGVASCSLLGWCCLNTPQSLWLSSQARVVFALHVFSAGTFCLIFSMAGSFLLFRHQRMTSPSPDHPEGPPVHLKAPIP